ncbi:MAG: DUF6152 family protein [Candidatus Rariloculaceae bacterium]
MKFVAINLLLLVSFDAGAHHAVTVAYDTNNLTAIEGEVTNVFWQNPHIVVTIERTLADGSVEEWRAESGSTNSLERVGIGRDIISIGDTISLYGAPSRRGMTTMAAYTMTLASGREVPLWPQRAVQLGRTIEQAPISEAAADAGERAADGIFRIWSRVGRSLQLDVSYTPEAVAAREGWDPLADDPALQCIPPGMPGMMNNPYPIEFVDEGDRILLRLEEWDGLRTIHMSDAAPDAQEASGVGYSTGQWEGNTLVVTTTNIDEPFFDDLGTPQGPAVRLVERFVLSDTQDRLDYRVTVTDASTFVEPATLTGHWIWNPGEEIKPFQCALPDA